MKKISTVVLALLVASVFAAGCSKKKPPEAPKTETTEPATGGGMYGGTGYGG